VSSPRDCSHAEVLEAKDGRILKRLVIEQNGIRYHDMVNALRDQLPPKSTCGTRARRGRERRLRGAARRSPAA